MINTPSNFSVKTEVFEGPLELLLDLVERRKLLINDISLASVTDEYLAQVSQMQALSLPNTTQFVALAATLLLVKSKSLLPVLELTEEEESSIEDLEERLKQYQIFREAGTLLQTQFGSNKLYSPQFTPPKTPLFVVDEYCTLTTLAATLHELVANLPKKTIKATAQVKNIISLEEMMQHLERRISTEIQLRFSDLHRGETERKVIIVGFLAVLELFRQGNLIINQGEHFADIEIEHRQSQTPSYY